MMANISNVVVIGAGQMGSGIAQVAAQAGLKVTVLDTQATAVASAQKRIESSLLKLQEKGILTTEVVTQAKKSLIYETFDRIENVNALESADLVIEAIVEDLQIKSKLFAKLHEKCPSQTILASNTSSISITKLAAATGRPERVVGMHFMNPVPIMKLVELIRGLRTSDEVFANVKTLAEKMGKTCVESKDFPGFVVNRILMPMINEAAFTLQDGIATAADIDAAMKLGTNQPMGPLALADFIGLDTCLSIMNVLHDGFGDSKYRPCPLLKQYVAAGLLGKKTNQGFYKY